VSHELLLFGVYLIGEFCVVCLIIGEEKHLRVGEIAADRVSLGALDSKHRLIMLGEKSFDT
jgi:hypothetical protein